MSNVGQRERATQKNVVAIIQQQLWNTKFQLIATDSLESRWHRLLKTRQVKIVIQCIMLELLTGNTRLI